jgi:hypothetical protein
VNVALVDAGVCAMIVDKALWDWPCILPETTIDKACAAAQAAVMLASFSPKFCMCNGCLQLDEQKQKGRRGDVNLHFEDISGMALAFRQVCFRVYVCVYHLARQFILASHHF